MKHESIINLDCRDALRCAIASASCLDAQNAAYWLSESRIYDLRMIGANPYGFNINPAGTAYIN